MWTILAGLVGNIFTGANDSYQKKQELKDARHSRELKRLTNNEEAAGNADLESIKGRTWGDEYLLILTTLPVLLLFLEPVYLVMFGSAEYAPGSMREGVLSGFKALEEMPEYAWWGLAAIYIDVLGFRRMLRIAIENVIAKKVSKL